MLSDSQVFKVNQEIRENEVIQQCKGWLGSLGPGSSVHLGTLDSNMELVYYALKLGHNVRLIHSVPVVMLKSIRKGK